MQELRGNWISPGAASSATHLSYPSIYVSLDLSLSLSPFSTIIYLRPAFSSLWPLLL